MQNKTLIRSLDLKKTMALVVGTVIGTGVFLKAAVMSQQMGSPAWVLGCWVFAGLLSLAGALCYAELGALFPRAGGEYAFLKEGYGNGLAFLYGWMRFWIGAPGSIAAYGVGAATFLKSVIPMENPQFLAVGFIITFTLLNCFSVSIGGSVQAFITLLKVVMILGLALSLLVFVPSADAWSNLFSGNDQWTGWNAFGAATLAALWAYDGWNNMPMAAGEVKNPGRTIPIALSFGMIIILTIYILINLTYFMALPFEEVASAYSNAMPGSLPVATKAATVVIGSMASVILSIAFVISALGGMNGSILTGARVPFAMAQDDLFPRFLAKVSQGSRVPIVSILVQGCIASILALSGSFDQLTDYVVFAAWIFYALTTASILIFRKKQPDIKRPFKVPFYPWLPIGFVSLSILLLINTLITSPRESGIGLAFILAGIPAYQLFKNKMKKSTQL